MAVPLPARPRTWQQQEHLHGSGAVTHRGGHGRLRLPGATTGGRGREMESCPNWNLLAPFECYASKSGYSVDCLP